MHPQIGINIPDIINFRQFQESLKDFNNDGFDGIEINIESFPFMVEGEISQKWVGLIRRELDKHSFFHTAHIGRGLDLRDRENHELHKKVLRSSIEVCRDLSCSLLVLHYELMSRNRKTEKQFFDAHIEAAETASRYGITLGIENIEVENVEPVVEFVDKIGMENVRIVFDTGHTFLAANYFDFDFFDAVKMMLPYLGHVHLSDNTGRFEKLRITERKEYDALPMGLRREFGRGDIHLPPYFGKIPFDKIFTILKGYSGRYICEYISEDYGPFNREIQETVRQRIIECSGSDESLNP